MAKSVKSSNEHIVIKVFRIILGLVFIFSSTMKGVDPIGTAYRVEDYLSAYNLLWLHGAELYLSFFLIVIEFILGVALLFKLYIRLAALGSFIIMLIFTGLTYFDALYEMVPDCGCFGDAVKLTAWETFYKNIFLIILALILFFKRNSIKNKIPEWLQTLLLILFAGSYIYFVSYNYNHLPMLDFRDWKIGNDMKSEGLDQVKTFVIYKNKSTGETKEYLSPEYPWNDSVWMAEWEFVDQRIDESGVKRSHNLLIVDYEGNNVTNEIIEHMGYQLILVSPDIETADAEGMIRASALYEQSSRHEVGFVLLSSSGEDIIDKYSEVYQINYPSYLADDTELKTMIRSNPGLILLLNGVVVNKWHSNDFPKTLDQVLNSE
ncbi:MAG TPA: BT_3928 family protein [Bacteroidales bacterium]